MNTKKKLLAPLLCITTLVIATLVYLSYTKSLRFFHPTTSPHPQSNGTPVEQSTGRWIPYTDNTLGITFSYPAHFFIQKDARPEDSLSITPLAPEDKRRHSSAAMGDMLITKVAQPTLKEASDVDTPRLSMKAIEIDGHKAIQIVSLPDQYSGGTWVHTYILTNKGVLKIQYLKDTEQEPSYTAIIKTIKIL
jgi:hypothetical protein